MSKMARSPLPLIFAVFLGGLEHGADFSGNQVEVLDLDHPRTEKKKKQGA